MTEKTDQSVANLGYHAHIYYDPAKTRPVAERVCAAISDINRPIGADVAVFAKLSEHLARPSQFLKRRSLQPRCFLHCQ